MVKVTVAILESDLSVFLTLALSFTTTLRIKYNLCLKSFWFYHCCGLPTDTPLPFLFAGVFGHWISLQRHPRRPTVRAERATRWVRQVARWRNVAAPTATAIGRKLSRKADHLRLPVAVRVYGQKLIGIHIRLVRRRVGVYVSRCTCQTLLYTSGRLSP